MDSNSKKIIYALVVVLLFAFLLYWFGAFSDSGSSKSKTETSETQTTQRSQVKQSTTTTTTPSVSNTRPNVTPPATKAALLELPVRNVVDMYYPEMYLSARWTAIVYGSLDSHDDIASVYLYDKIAITELDDPANSDLDPATFKQLRSLAIAVAQAEATGVDTENHPEFFQPGIEIDSCINFKTVAAGAISMPYPGDSSWALSIVDWKATCFPYSDKQQPHASSAQQTIYLHKVNGTWKAVPTTSIPRKVFTGQ